MKCHYFTVPANRLDRPWGLFMKLVLHVYFKSNEIQDLRKLIKRFGANFSDGLDTTHWFENTRLISFRMV